MLLQGFAGNTLCVKNMEDAELKSLAGEAMSLHAIGRVLLAVWLIPSAPWWSKE